MSSITLFKITPGVTLTQPIYTHTHTLGSDEGLSKKKEIENKCLFFRGEKTLKNDICLKTNSQITNKLFWKHKNKTTTKKKS